MAAFWVSAFAEDRMSSEAHAMPSLRLAKGYLPDSSVGVKEAWSEDDSQVNARMATANHDRHSLIPRPPPFCSLVCIQYDTWKWRNSEMMSGGREGGRKGGCKGGCDCDVGGRDPTASVYMPMHF